MLAVGLARHHSAGSQKKSLREVRSNRTHVQDQLVQCVVAHCSALTKIFDVLFLRPAVALRAKVLNSVCETQSSS